ncbi:MAG: DUF2935 domain-containing protein [Clostridia bacterium]|nr:DUF2935 domain-containing protein [Clostridia bacterium]
MRDYVRTSLELHLFFARIMKEHSFFLQAGFMPKNVEYIQEAMLYKRQFEQLLADVVSLSNCMVRDKVLKSGEIVTRFTYGAERKTEELTGIAIDSNITLQELKLMGENNLYGISDITQYVCYINETAITLLDGLINLKERLLRDVLSCKVFTANYPLLIEHILREAKLYRQYVIMLQRGEDINSQNMREVELFWNQIMMEHALFIRGLLDPTENDLITTAADFSKQYQQLIEEAKNMTDETIRSVTEKTIEETKKYIDFKTAGTEGIKECEIRSIILPLLADHVLREANHYFRLLKD